MMDISGQRASPAALMVLPVGQVAECQRLAQAAGYGTITNWLTPPA
jgi:hypothetical protein